MITKRIIPCLDVKNGRVVKGVNFEGLQDMADPVEMARYYNASGADELVFYDITASVEGRGLFTDILRRVASQIFIPLTVGGGINTLDDFDRVLKCGADKVSVNSGAIRNPGIIPAASQKYGNQCVVLSADIKRVDGKFMLFAKGGRENTGIDALDWLEQGVKNGAGELVVNSIDTDGVKNGFDLELLCFLCLCQTGLNALDCLCRLTAVTLSQKRIKRLAHIICFDPCESGERQVNRFNRHRHCIRTAQARNDVYLLGAIQFQCVGDRLTRKFQTL